MSINDEKPKPVGELALQTMAMPADTNASGDIFGGWLVSQMDMACSVIAATVARGRVATVSIEKMSFMVPVKVGAVVSCYCDVVSTGRSSMEIRVEVWASYPTRQITHKVTEGTFIFVALDDNGRTRIIESLEMSGR
ncbi:acyl-CoA thioesterase YciA [Sinobacterium caligoides]|uniref:Acyl-CoA thioesterase YciA n=1 Tax=Sinobacterium caligoides TaxID=933926 RepID=A0A3N2DH00_9GAMM|nr:acyl-CoA thioesterase [Sinobacterium caligoides]ROR99070.1 acyl-CoA thioesterase YciA [Sinobacterium caligoides]